MASRQKTSCNAVRTPAISTSFQARHSLSNGLLKRNPQPTDIDIDVGITNICRCGTYPRIRAAIHKAATKP